MNRESATPLPYHQSAKQLIGLLEGERRCMHPMPNNSECAEIVIRAHTLSRNAALMKIAQGQKVYQLNTDPFAVAKAGGEPQFKLEYIRSATTFTGFCSLHDSNVFRPIDQGDITPTLEQAFLLHYRSLCRELYVKRTSPATNELLRQADRGKPLDVQEQLQARVTHQRHSILDALQTLEQEKLDCDRALMTGNFELLRGAFVRFRETPSLACAGYTQPIFDFAATELQNPDVMSKPFHNLSFTLLPDVTGGVAVFSWLPHADTMARRFVQSFLALRDARKSDALVQFVFDSFENFAIQPEWWDSLPDMSKNVLKMNLINGTPMAMFYDTASLIPSTTHFADWHVEQAGWF